MVTAVLEIVSILRVRYAVQFCYFAIFCSIHLVLVRSADTVHVVYTLYAELVFWCLVVILGVMIATACRPTLWFLNAGHVNRHDH